MFNQMLARLRSRMFKIRLAAAVRFMPRIAGADGGEEPPEPKPKPKDPAAPSGEAKFTQEQVDQIVENRLSSVRHRLLDPEEAKALREKADKYDEIQREQQGEVERLTEDLTKASETNDQLKRRLQDTLRRTAIVTAAAEIGADPETVHALLADRGFTVAQGEKNFEVTVGDDDQVTGAAEAVKAIVELKNIVGPQTPAGPGDGGTREPVPQKSIDEQIAEAEKAGDLSTAMTLKSQKLAVQAAAA
jgi:hypothetical protein